MFSKNEKAKCKVKVRYTSGSAAQAALRKINPGHKLRKPYRIYKCPLCGGYHLTSSPKR